MLTICCLSFCLFFIYPATTEIYTYLPTLSLTVARPISSGIHSDVAQESATDHGVKLLGSPQRSRVRFAPAPGPNRTHLQSLRAERFTGAVCRSEEHTSELQSLMRISYAVFCLKKQTLKMTTTYTHS